MDPDATLRELRDLLSVPEEDRAPESGHWHERVDELFEALDTWLSRGGSLPGDWGRAA